MNGYQRNCHCACERCSRGRIMGGAILLTLGALFLVNGFTHFGFQWPVLLIVIGVVMVWQHAGSTEGHLSSISPGPPPPPPVPATDSATPGPSPENPQVPHV